jgi:hypothetical protein
VALINNGYFNHHKAPWEASFARPHVSVTLVEILAGDLYGHVGDADGCHPADRL